MEPEKGTGEIPTSVRIDLESPLSGKRFTIADPEGKPTDADFEKAKAAIERELAPYPPDVQRRAAVRLKQQYDAELKRSQADRDEKHYKLEAVEALKAWFEKAPALHLERNDCSRLHAFREALSARRVIAYPNEVVAPLERWTEGDHTFVVKHDWAAAFAHADGISDEIRLPYDNCCFEFRIAGRTIILFCLQAAGLQPELMEFLESQGYWYSPPTDAHSEPLTQYLVSQIRAICIALDAEVATHSVVRAPHKLNEKRLRAGKAPLSDYHVVDLSRRHRVSNPTGIVGGGGRKRLHFRRGHWRHYETTKTWVRWCLVGDPDLGFIQKQYIL